MIVALDSTPLASAVTGGIARYTSQLTAALAREFTGDTFVLVSDQHFALPCSAPNVQSGTPPRNPFERRWWTFGLQRELKRSGAEVFHGVDFAVPFPPTVPAAMTIHDLSPWRNDPWVDAAWRLRAARVRKRAPWMIRTRAAAHVITPSEAIRQEVLRFFRIEPGRVTAVPLAAAAHFSRVPWTPPRPYFLFAGMHEPRKNVASVLEAWKVLQERHQVDLVLAGPRRDDFHIPPPQPGLHRKGVVSEDELAKLYSGAVALVYPSRYEGFGLPVLEAMQCGTPAIISRDPALVETAGAAALQTADTQQIVQAMECLLTNADRRSELSARALERASHFSWEQTARETHAVYRSMLAA